MICCYNNPFCPGVHTRKITRMLKFMHGFFGGSCRTCWQRGATHSMPMSRADGGTLAHTTLPHPHPHAQISPNHPAPHPTERLFYFHLEVISIFSQHGSSCVAKHGNSFAFHKIIYFNPRFPFPVRETIPHLKIIIHLNSCGAFKIWRIIPLYTIRRCHFRIFFVECAQFVALFCKHFVLFISLQSATD